MYGNGGLILKLKKKKKKPKQLKFKQKKAFVKAFFLFFKRKNIHLTAFIDLFPGFFTVNLIQHTLKQQGIS